MGGFYFLPHGAGDRDQALRHVKPALYCRGGLLSSWLAVVFFALFETGSCCGIQAGLELCNPPSASLVLGLQVSLELCLGVHL